jgi:hypothetical protein
MAMTATAGFLNESQVLLERLAKNRWRSQSVARAAAESIPVLGTMAIFGGSSVGCALTTAASFFPVAMRPFLASTFGLL